MKTEKNEYYLKEIAEATKIAKNIFGDIVSKVYYANQSHHGLNFSKSVINSLKKTIKIIQKHQLILKVIWLLSLLMARKSYFLFQNGAI